MDGHLLRRNRFTTMVLERKSNGRNAMENAKKDVLGSNGYRNVFERILNRGRSIIDLMNSLRQ